MNSWFRFESVHPVLLLAFLFAVAVGGIASESQAADLAYIGTYTGAKSKGIYATRFDSASGKLEAPSLAAETPNPTFLSLHPNRRFLYAANEVNNFEGRPQGSVSAFAIDSRTGALTLLNQQPSGGGGPCHLSVDATGKCLLVANYGSGSVAALPVGADGRLGPPVSVIQHHGSSVNPQRQTGPHAHFITPDPASRFALACDLGLDQVLVYQLSATGCKLAPNAPAYATVKSGSGPRHLAFGSGGRFVYLLNEMASTITVSAYDSEHGVLTERQTLSTLPTSFQESSTCAEIQVHPSGKYVYASNRGHNSIAVFGVDPAKGTLTLLEHQSTQGKTPRHFTTDPTGRWLLAENQDSDSIVLFRLDPKTGRLAPAGQSVEVGAPVCLVFLPPR